MLVKWIALQPYYKVQREVRGTEQITNVQERTLYLYADRVVTRYREFPIADVFDMSFKQMGEAGGLLYLHTRHGVFPYTVKSDPSLFIKAYKSCSS